MRKSIVLIFFLIFFALIVYAQEETKKDPGSKATPPPGMVIKRIGNVDYMLPEDVEIEKYSNVVLIKDRWDYFTKKLLEMQEQLRQLNKTISGMKQEIEQLKQAQVYLPAQPPGLEEKPPAGK